MQAKERRSRAEQRLADEGVQVQSAPPVGQDERTHLRSTEEALLRALCLGVVGMYGDGLDREAVLEEVERWGLWPHFLPQEAALLRQESVDGATLAAWSWHQEGCFALLWALGLIDELGPSDPDQSALWRERLFSFDDLGALVSAAQVRPVEAILEEEEYEALYHATYEASLPKGMAPGTEPQIGPLPAPAVEHRLHALAWLTGSARAAGAGERAPV